MLTDTHAHLDDPAFKDDVDAVIARAREAGVTRILTIGTSLDSTRRARALAEAREGLWFAAGIHPHDAAAPGDVGEVEALAAHPKAVAVGEIGLDYFKNYAPVADQRDLLLRQLEIARRIDKPVSVHCRDAHADLIAILRERGPLRGVIHCFSGTAEDAAAYVGLGFHLSIAGPVTYPGAKALREAVRTVPLDRLLVETDCPYLAPQERRGQRNEPAYVRMTAAGVAALKDVPLEALAEETTRNARRLFGLD